MSIDSPLPRGCMARHALAAAALFVGVNLVGCGLFSDGGGGGGGNNVATAKWGDWTLTSFSGDVNYKSTVCGVKDVTYHASLTSGWNRINVDPQGVVSWYLGFDSGNETYDLAGKATATGGMVTGGVTDTETGTTSSLTGTYDATTMTAAWKYNQSITRGDCGLNVVGSGMFAANAP